MNFSAVRGYNAYAQFTAKIREAVKMREMSPEFDAERDDLVQEKPGSIFSDPVDTVSISHTARSMSLSITTDHKTAQITLREWIKETGSTNGILSHKVSGQTMAELISSNGLSIDENESYEINIDVWCAVTVTGKNAEKAKAIQELLNTTPSNINWGLILQKLPVDR